MVKMLTEPASSMLWIWAGACSTTTCVPRAGGGWPVPLRTVAARRTFCHMESSPLISAPTERDSLLAVSGRLLTIDSTCPCSR
ncbi:hypothetical protein D3C72_2302320 [compost metagenome]